MKTWTRTRWMLWTRWVAPMLAATAIVTAQTPAGQTTPSQTPIYRASAESVVIPVTPRDAKGQFVGNLTRSDFEVSEDGVPQTIRQFSYSLGGRMFGDLASPSAGSSTSMPVTEGLVLPKARPPADVAGRIFIIFIDDLHFTPDMTPRVKDILKQIRDTVLHDNDLVGFVSTGYSSISMDLAYDYQHRRMDEVIKKVMGSGPTINDMLSMPQTGNGLTELDHGVSVTFSTAQDILTNLAPVSTQRKAFIYISSGYDLNPFQNARLQREQRDAEANGQCPSSTSGDTSSQPVNDTGGVVGCGNDTSGNAAPQSGSERQYGEDPVGNTSMEFKQSELIGQLYDLEQAARRANVLFFPIDPRGLAASVGIEVNQAVGYADFRDFVTTTTSTLQSLAETTGGRAIVNTNDLHDGLQLIDNMTSDYYLLGYQSSNPDPLRIRRNVQIKVTRPGVRLDPYKDYYDLKRPPKAKPNAK